MSVQHISGVGITPGEVYSLLVSEMYCSQHHCGIGYFSSSTEGQQLLQHNGFLTVMAASKGRKFS